MSRFDPSAEQVTALRDSGYGGVHQCRVALKGRNLRRATRGATTDEEIREIILAMIDGIYPPDPPETNP
jgi:hypothetical protein